MRFVRFAGDIATRRGPPELLPVADDPPPSDARPCGESCGIMLDRRRGRSLRMGPMFDRRRPALLEPTALGVSGTRFAGLLWWRSRALPSAVSEELPESLEGEDTRFMLRSPMGMRRGEPIAAARSSSSSARLPNADDPCERDLRNPGSSRLALGRRGPFPRSMPDEEDEAADDVEGAEKRLKSMLVSVFSSSHSLSEPAMERLR